MVPRARRRRSGDWTTVTAWTQSGCGGGSGRRPGRSARRGWRLPRSSLRRPIRRQWRSPRESSDVDALWRRAGQSSFALLHCGGDGASSSSAEARTRAAEDGTHRGTPCGSSRRTRRIAGDLDGGRRRRRRPLGRPREPEPPGHPLVSLVACPRLRREVAEDSATRSAAG
jgi:hypothetical protein